MTTANFYKQFDDSIPRIQSFAFELTKDFEMARFLYLETAHQAIKLKKNLDQDKFEEWLINTMKRTYQKVNKKRLS